MSVPAAQPTPDRGDAPTVQGRPPAVLLGDKGVLGDPASAVGLPGLATLLVPAALVPLTRRTPQVLAHRAPEQL
ncbi:hypothetical protein ACWZEH_32005 [Streptomyces sp. QTS137]